MTDKRIVKSKKYLKQSLIDLLGKKTFEHITVKEICENAECSRITFYTYYDDKYLLVDDIFQDMIKYANDNYHRIQPVNKTKADAISGYNNLLECILNMYYDNYYFFAHTSPQENPYLYSSFYSYLLTHTVDYYDRHNAYIHSKYPSRQTAALICNGLWSVINESHYNNMDKDVIRNNARNMYKDLLESNLFIKTAPKL